MPPGPRGLPGDLVIQPAPTPRALVSDPGGATKGWMVDWCVQAFPEVQMNSEHVYMTWQRVRVR